MGTGPWGKALTATLRSPRALADGPLLVAEKPGQVVKEAAAPIPVRRERHDRSAAMVTHSERTHKHPRMQLQRAGCTDTEDNYRGC